MNQTINFLYFLHNFKSSRQALVGAFGVRMGEHFQRKLDEFRGEDQICRPQYFVKLIMEMSDDNKETFLQWIEKHYNYKGNSAGKDGSILIPVDSAE